jgi:hypothetical protein
MENEPATISANSGKSAARKSNFLTLDAFTNTTARRIVKIARGLFGETVM